MALTLYGVLRSRASRNVWLLEELGLPYDHVPVIQGYRLADPKSADAPMNTESFEFRRINPNGLVPVLEDGELVLNESLAINLHLAKKAGGPLAPKDLAEDSLMTMWALWAVTECERHTIQVLYNTIGKPEPERDPALLKASIDALQRPFDVLEAALVQGGGFAVGGRFTVADINLAEIMRYAQPAPALWAERPAMKAWIAAAQARPAFKRMMERRNAEPA
jgi:glutathione S-transferase